MARTQKETTSTKKVIPTSVETKEVRSKEVEIPSFDAYAIFQTGGKQYQAIEGKTVAIEKIEGEDGAMLEFNEVLLRKVSGGKIEIGKPFIKGAVKASIVKQMKEPKVISFMFKRRKKVRVKKGHRQPKTIVRIESI
jgi:large subunit ribosomal protein L21